MVATDLDTPANRKAVSEAARRRRGTMGRPDGSGPGAAPRLRSRARRDHPPRRDHPAADLSECQTREAGQRRGNRNRRAHRRGPTDVRRASSRRRATPCSAPAIRTGTPRRFARMTRCGPATCTAHTRPRPSRSCGRRAWSGWCCDRRRTGHRLSAMPFNTDALYFESALPTDARCTAWMSATWPGRSPRRRRPTSSARSC